jgi:hypothetical protein
LNNLAGRVNVAFTLKLAGWTVGTVGIQLYSSVMVHRAV